MFYLSAHPLAADHTAQSMLRRLEADVRYYAASYEDSMPYLSGLAPSELRAMAREAQAARAGAGRAREVEETDTAARKPAGKSADKSAASSPRSSPRATGLLGTLQARQARG